MARYYESRNPVIARGYERIAFATASGDLTIELTPDADNDLFMVGRESDFVSYIAEKELLGLNSKEWGIHANPFCGRSTS